MWQIFIRKIKGWSIIWKEEIEAYIQSLPDWYYEIGFKTFDNRTDALRKYYRGVVLEVICREVNGYITREGKNDLHKDFLKALDKETTKDMNKDEWMDYIDNIKDMVSPIIIPASDLFNNDTKCIK